MEHHSGAIQARTRGPGAQGSRVGLGLGQELSEVKSFSVLCLSQGFKNAEMVMYFPDVT